MRPPAPRPAPHPARPAPSWARPGGLLVLAAALLAGVAPTGCAVAGEPAPVEASAPPLPARDGGPATTSGKVPHVEQDVVVDPARVDELVRRALLLPDVVKRPTIVSLPGSWGLWLEAGAPIVDRGGIVKGREFAHIHPDGSLHLPLPPKRLQEAVDAGWVERHPWIDTRPGFSGLAMLFSPRSAAELEVTLQIIADSYNHVTGRSVTLDQLGGSAAVRARSSTQALSVDEVEFIALNPARGDASPRAGALWGTIREDVASGSLVRFTDGFESPPHIHNITYRAVVLQGEIHNADPAAERAWMGPGSFWTQPAGGAHITAARGEDPLIFLEILSGPYLVRPPEEATDSGERAVTVAAGDAVWRGAADSPQIQDPGPEIAHLWGALDGGLNARFVRLPAGSSAGLTTTGPSLRVVAVHGTTEARLEGHEGPRSLAPGSFFASTGEAAHDLTCASPEPCVLYVRAEGGYVLAASTPAGP